MTTRDRNVLVAFVLFLVLGAFWFLALSPRREEAASLASQVQAAQQQRDDAARQAAIANTAKENYDADYAVVARLGKAVPAEDDTASLLFQLQEAAGRSRVVLKSIAPAGANGAPAGNAAAAPAAAPGAVPGPAGVTAMPLDLSFSGTYGDLQRFIRRVHRFADVDDGRIQIRGRLLSIDGFKFATSEDSNRLEAIVTATAYVEAPVAAPPVDGAAPATGAAAPPQTAAAPPAPAPAPAAPAAPAPTPAAVVAGG